MTSDWWDQYARYKQFGGYDYKDYPSSDPEAPIITEEKPIMKDVQTFTITNPRNSYTVRSDQNLASPSKSLEENSPHEENSPREISDFATDTITIKRDGEMKKLYPSYHDKNADIATDIPNLNDDNFYDSESDYSYDSYDSYSSSESDTEYIDIPKQPKRALSRMTAGELIKTKKPIEKARYIANEKIMAGINRPPGRPEKIITGRPLKVTPMLDPKEKIQCELCGSVVFRKNMYKHKKTKKHQYHAKVNATLGKMILAQPIPGENKLKSRARKAKI